MIAIKNKQYCSSIRALAVKRKLEAAKEERRRQEILARRKEQQNEATTRFQRLGKPREQLLGKYTVLACRVFLAYT